MKLDALPTAQQLDQTHDPEEAEEGVMEMQSSPSALGPLTQQCWARRVGGEAALGTARVGVEVSGVVGCTRTRRPGVGGPAPWPGQRPAVPCPRSPSPAPSSLPHPLGRGGGGNR